jgi:uncharacterized membrane protein HdeD (DUF308 family)
MGVNASSFIYHWRHPECRKPIGLAIPLLGFLICAFLWLNLSHAAFLVGVVWLVAGIAYGAFRTRGFRAELINFEIPPDEA